MTDIATSLNVIQEEETQFRASLSENLFQRVGGVTNQIVKKYFDKHAFNFNGNFSLGVGSSGPDGVFSFPFAFEITAFYYRIGQSGSGGSSILDIHDLDADGTDNGSIFSTLPEVSNTAANKTITQYDVLNSSTVSNPAGHTLAVLSTSSFAAGQQLECQIDASASGAVDISLVIFYRPT
jgi:hypothetical protein